MKNWLRNILALLLSLCCLVFAGCNGNVGVGVGVGMSSGVPLGNNGHVRVGGHRWL